MIIKRLTLNNFGPYNNEVTVDLKPQENKPIVLFGGLNGAGKTTILDAISIAFFGKKYFKKASSYQNYLKEMFHKNRNGSATNMSVSIEFDYQKSGTIFDYKIVRKWSNNVDLKENFEIYENGDLKEDLLDRYWDDFVEEIIPYGVSKLFFFDGEKIKSLAEDENDTDSLKDSIDSLLNFKLIDKLIADLNIAKREENKNIIKNKQIKSEILSLEKKVATLQKSCSDFVEEQADLNTQLNLKNNQKMLLEERFSALGGNLVLEQEKLREKQKFLIKNNEDITHRLKEISFKEYPFSICRDILKRMIIQAKNELNYNDSLNKKKVFLEEKPNFLNKFADMNTETISHIYDQFIKDLGDSNEKIREVLGLNWKEYYLLESQINNLSIRKKEVRSNLNIFQENQEELYDIEIKLNNVPDEKDIKPLLEQLNSTNQEIGVISQKIIEAERKIDSIKQEIFSANKKWEELSTLEIRNESSKIMINIDQSIETLTKFKKKLIENKVKELENNHSFYFKSLARKNGQIQKVLIDPQNYDVRIISENEQELSKKRLSAGEKQLYAISMLWALAKTSGKNLPVIVDTPLGRLDSIHRKNVLTKYFPYASQQVIILSTDTEIDNEFYGEIQDYLSHSYKIKHLPEQGETYIEEGYFWKDHTHERN